MGDRANVAIVERTGRDTTARVWLYTHWSGYELAETVQGALALRERWDDPHYLAAIVFSHMIAGHRSSTTGFGIGAVPDDYNYPHLVLDVTTQMISIENAGLTTPTTVGTAISFDAFVALNPAQARHFRQEGEVIAITEAMEADA